MNKLIELNRNEVAAVNGATIGSQVGGIVGALAGLVGGMASAIHTITREPAGAPPAYEENVLYKAKPKLANFKSMQYILLLSGAQLAWIAVGNVVGSIVGRQLEDLINYLRK